jgi:hypothetical protein
MSENNRKLHFVIPGSNPYPYYALRNCSIPTDQQSADARDAPWYVVPADDKENGRLLEDGMLLFAGQQ